MPRTAAEKAKRWEKENQLRLEAMEKKTKAAAKVASKKAIAAAGRWSKAWRKANARAGARALTHARAGARALTHEAGSSSARPGEGLGLVEGWAGLWAEELALAAAAQPQLQQQQQQAAPAADAQQQHELQTPLKKKNKACVQMPSNQQTFAEMWMQRQRHMSGDCLCNVKNAEEVQTPSNSSGSMNVEAVLRVKRSVGSIASDGEDAD